MESRVYLLNRFRAVNTCMQNFKATMAESGIIFGMSKRFARMCLAAALNLWLNGVSWAHNNEDWMGRFDPQTSLAGLSIPGTHDTGARRERFPGTTKCQKLSLSAQLDAGVRYMDIRCHPQNGRFAIYHGPVDQRLSFEQVLGDCGSFLNSHTNECVLMAVQEENAPPHEDPHAFETIFYGYVLARPDQWYLQPSIPTLGQARGKIVLIRRFHTQHLPEGIDATAWMDNAKFLMNCGPAEIEIQDQYRVENVRQKWGAVADMLGEAADSHPEWLFINYTSGFKRGWFGLPRIRQVSRNINPLVVRYFEPGRKARFGIVAMDFATPALCSLIINSNP
jgi:1-phosphatidylinositol phosphodiesterase